MGQEQGKFGWRTWNLDVMILGVKTLEEFKEDLQHFVNFLGMDTANIPPDIHCFPISDGRGGEGQSLFQSFVEPKHLHQALTTSFIVIDAWPEHFTMTIKSCMRFSAEVVLAEVRRRFGVNSICDCNAWTLGRVARG